METVYNIESVYSNLKEGAKARLADGATLCRIPNILFRKDFYNNAVVDSRVDTRVRKSLQLAIPFNQQILVSSLDDLVDKNENL